MNKLPNPTLDELIGEDVVDTYAVLPDRSLVYIPPLQIGDGLAGPENDQPLQIFRDNRPIGTDFLEGEPFHKDKLARHRAGRQMPLNYTWGAGLDPNWSMPDTTPLGQPRRPSPLYWGQDPAHHDGFRPPAVVANPNTIFYTATPDVGWEGY